MKKLCFLAGALCLAAILAGCSHFLVQEYQVVTPHTEQGAVEENDDALTAQNYVSLRNAILSFVEDGVEDGVIRIYDYSGDVEEDLAAAAYDVAKNDPLGAYAVDYMTHDCTLIVSYYEIHIRITFRRTLEQIQAVRRASSMSELTQMLENALDAYDSELTVRVPYYSDLDAEELVFAHYWDNPATAMELPEVSVSVYPESGYVRIVEIRLDYDQDAEELVRKQEAVATNVRAAREYVRYRQTETEKLQLLYTYLMERFSYDFGETTTPVYSFLCGGIAGSDGCARSMQIICDQIGLECYTVQGQRDGEDHTWNIVCVDGVYCHTDLYRSLSEQSESLTLWKEESMTGYDWDLDAYPRCL